MSTRLPQTAFCIVRLEHQQTGLLITLRMFSGLWNDNTGWTRSFADIDGALFTLRAFMETFDERGSITDVRPGSSS